MYQYRSDEIAEHTDSLAYYQALTDIRERPK